MATETERKGASEHHAQAKLGNEGGWGMCRSGYAERERESFMEMRAATVSSLSVLLTSAQYCACTEQPQSHHLLSHEGMGGLTCRFPISYYLSLEL